MAIEGKAEKMSQKARNFRIAFSFDEAMSRNIGWVTEPEQKILQGKKAAVAGMGGVGGFHLTTLARLGIGTFHVADFDAFELANFNRQLGATMKTLGRSKVDVLENMARDINPEATIRAWPDGVNESNLDAFLDGVDVFVDGLDFFALDIRRKVFARCHELGIPAITAGPIGMGAACLVFMPGQMTFEKYFRLNGLSQERQYVNFFLGLVPKGLQQDYLMDPSRLDLAAKKGPSSVIGCELCAGVAGAEAVKILLNRGPVRAAPAYCQFDAYLGKFVKGRLRAGNRNPLQRFKLKCAYRYFEGIAQEKWSPPSAEHASDILNILDKARWAPSGDNSQPWRFEIIDDDRVVVHIRVEPNVYEFNNGEPTLLSAGMLLETMRIAASEFGRSLWWEHAGTSGDEHEIAVQFPKTVGTSASPLAPYIAARSVDRRTYRRKPLTRDHKMALAAALGDELKIQWHETTAQRWRMARIGAMATDIRLRIPETFSVHQKILDWNRRYSSTGIPAAAVGLDRLTLRIMRWALKNWKRTEFLNKLPSATLPARIQMDYLPGFFSAAHFVISRRPKMMKGDRVGANLRAGEALQRFWLTASKLGLVLQPNMAPLCFSHYGRNQIEFSQNRIAPVSARNLAASLADAVVRANYDDGKFGHVIFTGRIGIPKKTRMGPRSVRRPLEELMIQSIKSSNRFDLAAKDSSPLKHNAVVQKSVP